MIKKQDLENKFTKELIKDANWEYDDNIISILKETKKDNATIVFTIKVNNKVEKFDVLLIISEQHDKINGFCSCEESLNNGICKHMVMGCIAINDHLSLQEQEQVKAKTDLYKLDLLKKIYAPQKKYDSVVVDLLIRNSELNKFKIDLRVSLLGNKPYTVKNVDKFINDITNDNYLNLGKELVSNNYKIDILSQNLLRELKLLVESFKNNQKSINTQLVDIETLSILLKTKINQRIYIYDAEYLIKDRLDDIVIYIDYLMEHEYMIKLKRSNEFEYLTNGIVINHLNKVVYVLNAQQLNKIKLLDSFNDEKKEFIVVAKEAEDFINNVVPNIYNEFEIKFAPQFNFTIIDECFKASLYCYQENKVIKIKPIFKYGEYEVGIKQENILIKRNYEKENFVIQSLINQGYIYDAESMCFIVSANRAQYYFLTKNLFDIKQNYDVFLDEKLQKKILNYEPNQSKFNIDFNEEKEYFEIDFSLGDVNIEELNDILKSYADNKEYHLMQDNRFISLTDSQLINQLLFLKEVIGDNSHKLNTYRIPKYQAFKIKSSAEKLFGNLTSNHEFDDYIEKITLIEDLEIKVFNNKNYQLRDYQVKGVSWLTTLYKASLGGLLADEMGLGKTIQVISFFEVNLIKKAIIVMPKALLYNWEAEFKRFNKNQKIVIIEGNKQQRTKICSKLKGDEIILIAYSTLINDYEYFIEQHYECIVIDEAQYIKNAETKTSRVVKQLQGNFFIALTGTPIENNLLELWSLFDFIIPGYLQNSQEFVKKYINNNKNKEKLINQLKQITKPFILRRNKNTVLKELPEKVIRNVYCEMPEMQKALYANYINDIKQKKIINTSNMEVLAAITRLRQISIDPSIVYPDYLGDNAKLIMFDEIIDEIITSNKKVVIFSQFTKVLKKLEQRLEEKKIKSYYLDGKTKPKQRLMDVEKFNKNHVPVYLISLKAGGVGLNLVGASNVIIYDPWWNPAVEAQAIDRAHRIGQNNNVQVFRFLTKDTIEEKINLLNEQKKIISDDILDEEVSYLNKLSIDVIKDLLEE